MNNNRSLIFSEKIMTLFSILSKIILVFVLILTLSIINNSTFAQEVNGSEQSIGKNCNTPERATLIKTIREQSARMEVLPLDLIIDTKQLTDNSHSATTAKQFISVVGINLLQNPKSGSPKFHISGTFCIDKSFDDFRFYPIESNLLSDFIRIERRYDLTYERFLEFKRFYDAALRASEMEISECVDNFENASVKEKALTLIAIYIFEQCNREHKNRLQGNSGVSKYDNRPVKTISDSTWNTWINLLRSCVDSPEIAFEAIDNKDVVEKWESSFRLNTALFQDKLGDANPFFQSRVPEESYWNRVCSLLPISFLYALLLYETEPDVYQHVFSYRRSKAMIDPIYAFQIKNDLQNPDKLKERALRLGLRYDGSAEFAVETWKMNEGNTSVAHSQESNLPFRADDLTLMREYLNTQFNFSRNCFIDHNRLKNADVYNINTHSWSSSSKFGPIDANTSYEAKTLGFIATSLIHARKLFDESE